MRRWRAGELHSLANSGMCYGVVVCQPKPVRGEVRRGTRAGVEPTFFIAS
jgi:hypothetical protein